MVAVIRMCLPLSQRSDGDDEQNHSIKPQHQQAASSQPWLLVLLMLMISLGHGSCHATNVKVIAGCDHGRSSLHHCPPGVSSEGYLQSPGYSNHGNSSQQSSDAVYTYLFINNHTALSGRVSIQFIHLDIHPNSSIQIFRDPNRADMFVDVKSTDLLPRFTSLVCCMSIRYFSRCCDDKQYKGFRIHYRFIKPCPQYQTSCNNGMCLSRRKFCNHRNDCGDNSDEAPDICPGINGSGIKLQIWQKVILGCGIGSLIVASYGYSYYKKRQRKAIRQQRQAAVCIPAPPMVRSEEPVHTQSTRPVLSPPAPPPFPQTNRPTSGFSYTPPIDYSVSGAGFGMQPGHGLPSDPPPPYRMFEQTPDGAAGQKNYS